jgi:biopolymer transport protein ExbB
MHPSREASMKTLKTLLVATLLLPLLAQAWWNKDWKERTQVVLNTSPAGVETHEAVSSLAVPLRLHSGNFDFLAAKPDGSDLRVLSGDDKTPLKYWIERYDSANELALVWVLVPNVVPGTDKNLVYVYAGNDKAAATPAPAAGVADGALAAVFHFSEKDGIPLDQSGTVKAAGAITIEPNGLIGPSARLIGAPLVLPANDKTRLPNSGWTLSLWARPDAAQGTLYSQGPLSIAIDGGKLAVKLGAVSLAGGDFAAAAWSQLALTAASGKLTLYLNGAQAGQADLGGQSATVEGDIRIGENYQGLVDELQLAGAVRSADWIRLAHSAESADAKLLASKTETPDTAESSGEGGSPGYFGILIKNLTPDAWVVIIILFIMFLIAAWVMIGKALFLRTTESGNRAFMRQFREARDVLRLGIDNDSPGILRNSPLYRLYQAGVVELDKRDVGHNRNPLSGPSLDAVKASIDADMVRENYRLNNQMVLLTIAIAGGPFLGLLGTVVGVMITFAAIAAAGDVNVNAIAPGIAAALLATVAGLAVAIPSLFGYNYLASRIKVVSSDMQIFVDEFVTRVAELYGAR